MVAAVAVGAVVSAAQAAELTGESDEVQAAEGVALTAGPTTAFGTGGDRPAPEALPLVALAPAVDSAPVDALAKGERMLVERLEQEAEAARPQFVVPAIGSLTSGFGARWGTTHFGIDLANRIGTPILAAADGVVVESGPASGFGMWVKLLHDDGFTTIYGHINRSLVEAGQQVKAGEKIAEMGNRGYSTGPHLHFEVWDPEGKKVNPIGWFAERNLKP